MRILEAIKSLIVAHRKYGDIDIAVRSEGSFTDCDGFSHFTSDAFCTKTGALLPSPINILCFDAKDQKKIYDDNAPKDMLDYVERIEKKLDANKNGSRK